MTLSIIAAFPIESKLVPSFLENIIDKKVAEVALNLLEKLADWICSWIYYPYNALYTGKLSRIHLFSDAEVPLFDSTLQGIARIEHDWKNDYITLHGHKVYFSPIPHVEIVFSKAAFTEYVVVQDDENRRAGWYKISELGTSHLGNPLPMVKSWRVNTNKLHRIIGGPLTSVYLAEQALPLLH